MCTMNLQCSTGKQDCCNFFISLHAHMQVTKTIPCLILCKQMHVTHVLFGLEKQNKDFLTLHEQANKMVYSCNRLSLAFLSNG